ncbi:hypothetical protein IV203_010189 [Nitzschia inconspicua]|uniref:Uncharacterized protein n=1 Tax=Nitzschia inconspicua TaxID=303405 RepID=A0A9K3KWS9_9STRA|nr:hypothetical protein IV203_010189 [Nitzschia inconspicua]
MKSIKTLDEYKASKALLFSYVNSEEVVKVIGDDTADNIATFLRSNVAPTAPVSTKSMDEGRYSAGSKSEDKFMSITGEDLFLYFQALMKNKLSILNYNIEHVEKAEAVMEKHQVGMTQEMHNCSADFSFVRPGDETLDVANPVGSHEVLNRLYKELTQLCDVAGKDKTAKTARDLETL